MGGDKYPKVNSNLNIRRFGAEIWMSILWTSLWKNYALVWSKSTTPYFLSIRIKFEQGGCMSHQLTERQKSPKKKLNFYFISFSLLILASVSFPLYIYLAPVFETDMEIGHRGGILYGNLFSKSDQITPNSIYVLTYKVAPGGNRIAITYTDYGWDTSRADQYIGIFNIWTKELQPVLHIEKPDDTSHIDLSKWQTIRMAWSPDGQKLLFNMLSKENDQELYIFNAMNQKITKASNLDEIFNEPIKMRIAYLNWSPGKQALLNLCSSNNSMNSYCNTYLVKPDFSSIDTRISDSYLSQWLPDGKIIVYSCLEKWTFKDQNQVALKTTGLCSYSIQDKKEKMITNEIKSAIWSANGRYAVEIVGGAEGKVPYFRVYNSILNRVYNLPFWIIHQ
jgi:hypothetical protein